MIPKRAVAIKEEAMKTSAKNVFLKFGSSAMPEVVTNGPLESGAGNDE